MSAFSLAITSLLANTILGLGPIPDDAEVVWHHRLARPSSTDGVLPAIPRREALSNSASGHRAVGYLPYWSDVAEVPWDSLDEIIFFSLEIDASGTVQNDRGFERDGAALVAEARAHGVATSLAVTLFDPEGINTLLSSSLARGTLIDELDRRLGEASGINLDFEVVPPEARASFVNFLGELRDYFGPSVRLSVAIPAVDWRDAYDIAGVTTVADAYIMGYDYHWSTSDPGPVAPIDSGTFWNSRDLRSSIEHYVAPLHDGQRARLYLGIPFYGREWPTSDVTVPGNSVGSASTAFYHECSARFASSPPLWDMISQTPYLVVGENTGNRQLFCENNASIRAKLDLIREYDLAGVMVWALGYTRRDPGVWSDVDALTSSPSLSSGVDEVRNGKAQDQGCAGVGSGALLFLALLRRRRAESAR